VLERIRTEERCQMKKREARWIENWRRMDRSTRQWNTDWKGLYHFDYITLTYLRKTWGESDAFMGWGGEDLEQARKRRATTNPPTVI